MYTIFWAIKVSHMLKLTGNNSLNDYNWYELASKVLSFIKGHAKLFSWSGNQSFRNVNIEYDS